jgi:hypothetical protein
MVPSIAACNAFGINRTGSKKITETSSFLKGPQFKGIKVATPEPTEYENVVEEVILEFIGNKPVSIKPKTEGGIVKMEIEQKEIQKNLYTIRIAPSTTDWLKFNFAHEWGEGDGIVSRILDTVASLVDTASGLVNTAQNAGAAAGMGTPQSRKKVTLDKQDTYQKTDKVSFKLPFILFSAGTPTNGNKNPIEQWVEDVYAPLLTITAWSHPKRATGIIGGKDASNLGVGDLASAAGGGGGGGGGAGGGLQEEAIKMLSSYPGMRVAISEPPSYVRVTHSSGFFQYNVCAITNFSYSFEGPWVKAYSLVPPTQKITDQERQLLDVTIPMVARCELEIKVIEKMYADDWIAMFEQSPLLAARGGGGVSSGIVNVLKTRV